MLPGSLKKKATSCKCDAHSNHHQRRESFFFFFNSSSSHSLMTTKRVFVRLKPTAALWPGSRLPLKPGRSCITIPPSCCRGICTSLQCRFFIFFSLSASVWQQLIHAGRRRLSGPLYSKDVLQEAHDMAHFTLRGREVQTQKRDTKR